MIHLKKQILLFIITLICTHTHCMELALPHHLQHLAHTAMDQNQCKQLNSDDYTDLMIHYAQTGNKAELKKLASNTNQENRQVTREIAKLRNGRWSLEIPFRGDELMETFGENLPNITAPDSLEGHYAAKTHLVGALRFFLKLNNNPNIRDTKGRTPLHCIACNKDETPFIAYDDESERINYNQKNNDALKLFIAHPKRDIIAQDDEGNTPIHYAANFKLIDHFLAIENIDLNVKNKQGETPLFYSLHHCGVSIKGKWKYDSVKYNDYQFERLCDDHRTDINTQNNNGETPLHYLIKNPRITERENHSGNFDIYRAPTLSYDNKQTERLLQRSDIQPNKEDNNKETPLHCAVKINSKIRDYKGERHDFADHYKKCILNLGDQIYLDNLQLLLKHPNTIINPKNKYGETPLICAVKAENIPAIEQLLLYTQDNLPDRKKIDINAEDNSSKTALNYASEANNENIINLLIKHGAIRGSFVFTTTVNNENIIDLSAKPKATPDSFFYKHKKVIQVCSLISIMGMLASIMAYLHYR